MFRERQNSKRTLKALFTSISGQWFGYNDYNDYKWTYFPNINHKKCDENKILPVNEVLWSYLRGTIISFILFPGPWFSDFSWIMKIVKYCIGWFGTFLLIVRTAWLPTGRNWIYDGGNVKHNWADHRCCSSTFGWNSWLIILMQSFRTGCGKHNKLINAVIEIIFNAYIMQQNDRKKWSKMAKKNGKLPHAVPDLGVSHEICVVRIRVTEVTGFSDSYVHFWGWLQLLHVRVWADRHRENVHNDGIGWE